jgi:hypothetical protein
MEVKHTKMQTVANEFLVLKRSTGLDKSKKKYTRGDIHLVKYTKSV